MQVKILGRTWDFSFAELGTCRGLCDPPSMAGKRIRVQEGLSDELELDTTIHEFLHAGAHEVLAEEWVETIATDIARELIRLGWRKD